VKNILPGSQKAERSWHRKFGYLRLHGEWFQDAAELRQCIINALFETHGEKI
jgi:hypothetical protein